MALLLIIACWLLLLSLIMALCRAARLGDRQPPQGSPTPTASASRTHHAATPSGRWIPRPGSGGPAARNPPRGAPRTTA
jgi:hypothetical protein